MTSKCEVCCVYLYSSFALRTFSRARRILSQLPVSLDRFALKDLVNSRQQTCFVIKLMDQLDVPLAYHCFVRLSLAHGHHFLGHISSLLRPFCRIDS